LEKTLTQKPTQPIRTHLNHSITAATFTRQSLHPWSQCRKKRDLTQEDQRAYLENPPLIRQLVREGLLRIHAGAQDLLGRVAERLVRVTQDALLQGVRQEGVLGYRVTEPVTRSAKLDEKAYAYCGFLMDPRITVAEAWLQCTSQRWPAEVPRYFWTAVLTNRDVLATTFGALGRMIPFETR
jgi:hypothetical protein